MLSRFLAVFICMATLLGGTAAQAVTWPQIGAACTPERAQPWNANVSEINQAACHCPPPSFCPQFYAEFVDISRYRMPPAFVNRCCPVLQPPICPSNTVHAGEAWPDVNDSNSCDRCPASDHTNELASSLGGLSPVVENCWDHCPAGSYPPYVGLRLEQVPNRNCNPPICPPNTQGAGGLAPNGDINQCAPLCTYGSLIGQVRPADNECDPQFCPPGTQHAGARMYPTTDCGYYCPGGTYYQGSLVNSVPNGNCNPAICPPGTIGEGQPAPNGDISQCPAAGCPAKYYPTLSEAGMPAEGLNRDSTGNYYYRNGAVGNFASGYALESGLVGSLTNRYGFSLRQATFGYRDGLDAFTASGAWELPDNRLGLWILGPTLCTYWNYLCTFNQTYGPYTDWVNDGFKPLRDLVQQMGHNNLTWYGLSVVKPDRLSNNLMSDAMLNEWGGRDIVEIGNTTPIANFDINNSGGGYRAVAAGPVLENEGAGFLRECRGAGGEYAELERLNIGGRSCAYLQCRYTYSPDGAESCLTGDTAITLADGSARKVSELKLGDVVKGSDGDHKITASNIYQSALRVMYGVNGSDAMLTGDHPIRTTEGWKVITDEAAKLYADKPGFATATKLAVGDTLITEKGEVKVTEIKRFANVEPISTYNIRVEGNNGFYANGIEVRGFDKMEMHY